MNEVSRQTVSQQILPSPSPLNPPVISQQKQMPSPDSAGVIQQLHRQLSPAPLNVVQQCNLPVSPSEQRNAKSLQAQQSQCPAQHNPPTSGAESPAQQPTTAVTTLAAAAQFNAAPEANYVATAGGGGSMPLPPTVRKPKKRIVLEVLSVVYGENNQPVRSYYTKAFEFFY